MADYYTSGEDDLSELRSLNAEVTSHPDDFENWEKLVRAAESLEGGLNRNSSPQSISAARDVYDRFLAKFPLFFGYWKKYADLEFSIAGTESAEFIYERAIASVPVSVDLWTNFCNFKVETCHDSDLIRELFERGAESVGLDFLAHPFWDKYIEFEDRLEQPQRIFSILSRIIAIPLHQYARYFERYRALAHSRPVVELAPPDILHKFSEQGTLDERALRAKMDQYYLTTFNKTQAETTKRWTYESEIKRPYFHVTELEEAQLSNWSKYLDFEEGEGSFSRITFLYERCLVATAHYEEYWLRYARFVYAQKGKEQETRNIFERASCIYTAIARPAIRFQYALFEESLSRPDVAAAIYESVLFAMPDHIETVARLANLTLRQHGPEEAKMVYEQYIASAEEPNVKGALIGELAALTLRTSSSSSSSQARLVFEQHRHLCPSSEAFWSAWLDFETSLPDAQHESVKRVHDDIRGTAIDKTGAAPAKLTPDQVKALSSKYIRYLTDRGPRGAAREALDLDSLVAGSGIVVQLLRAKNADAEAVIDGKAGEV